VFEAVMTSFSGQDKMTGYVMDIFYFIFLLGAFGINQVHGFKWYCKKVSVVK